MLVFLALNGYELYYSQKELSDVILALASGDIGEKEILQWIIEHQQYLYGDFYNKTTQY